PSRPSRPNAGVRDQMTSMRRASLAAVRSVLFPFLALLAALPARADRLDEVRAGGVLRWGADAEGGAPFVYDDPREDGRRLGFEVEIADVIAARIGVRAEMKQHNWAEL